MKKIAIITPFLANGGLEKVAIISAQQLSKHYDITLIVMDSFHIDYPYNGKLIDLKVSLISRSIIKRFYNTIKAIIKLYRLKRNQKYAMVISHGELANIPNVLSGGTRNILTIHGNRFDFKTDGQGKLVNKVIKYIYSSRSVYKIITVSKGIAESFIENIQIKRHKIMAIYNPINILDIQKKCIDDLGKYRKLFNSEILLTAGRLSFAKGHWYLLRIFAQYKKNNPTIKLVMLGDGEMRDKLIDLSNALGLNTFSEWSSEDYTDKYDVYFLGFQKNPFKFIKASKLFIMTSLWEGFGNTIVEAMASGTPVISTACKSGPGEIINPELVNASQLKKPNYEGFGVLMPIFVKDFVGINKELGSQEKLWVETLEELLNKKKELEGYSKVGLKRANDFQEIAIMAEWKKLIDSALSHM